MAEYTGNFETGTHGNTVATTDAGSNTPWDARGFDANGTLTYSNLVRYNGTLSCEMVLSATPSGPYVAWTISPTLTELWGRIYMWHSANPAFQCGVIRGFNTAVRAWEITIDASGHVLVQDNGGRWHHVAATSYGIGSAKIYIDGIQMSGTPAGFHFENNTQAYGIGASWNVVASAPDANTYFVGNLDEVAIYSYALSPERVLAHYQAGIGTYAGREPTTQHGVGMGKW